MSDEAKVDRKLEAMQVLMDLTRRRERHRVELERLEALRDAERARIDAWFEDVSHGERAEMERLDGEIEGWAVAHRTERAKSWTTPYAKVTTRVKSGETVVDDEELLTAWCEENGYARVTVKPDVKAMRAEFAVVDGQLVYPIGNAEFRQVPGVHVEGHGATGVTIKPFVVSADDDEEA